MNNAYIPEIEIEDSSKTEENANTAFRLPKLDAQSDAFDDVTEPPDYPGGFRPDGYADLVAQPMNAHFMWDTFRNRPRVTMRQDIGYDVGQQSKFRVMFYRGLAQDNEEDEGSNKRYVFIQSGANLVQSDFFNTFIPYQDLAARLGPGRVDLYHMDLDQVLYGVLPFHVWSSSGTLKEFVPKKSNFEASLELSNPPYGYDDRMFRMYYGK
ncbi:uncharacterized protein KY384_000874 [Bacidia gigantensis]|uniref:uncharacterized protein n=1 Tax=Bacidia gigantensis TaxID=2732470 RepID=UPI001D0372F7|nr:uncharacterized protein KY384_000874 [Bacidia gigantensis]KAG8534031.1 hypothetical protein KY384_000874 [Bacidia gigantensis]